MFMFFFLFSSGSENVIRASIALVLSSKQVKLKIWVNYPFNNAQVTETQLSKRQPRVQKVKGAPELKFSLVTMHGALVSPTVAPTPSPAPPLAPGEAGGGLHSFERKLFTVAATDSPPLTHSTPSSSFLHSPF